MDLINSSRLLYKVKLKSGKIGWVVYSLGCKLEDLQKGDCVRIAENIRSNNLTTGFISDILLQIIIIKR